MRIGRISWICALAGLHLMALSWRTQAAVLELVPRAAVLERGAELGVGVFISGLQTTVSAFSLDVLFDPGIIRVTRVEFGPALGDAISGEALAFDSGTSGQHNVAEISFLGLGDLAALQSDRFELATLFIETMPTALGGSFAVLGFAGTAGTSAPMVLDDQGNPVEPLELNGTQVTVVAEPAGIALLLASMMGAIAVRTRTREFQVRLSCHRFGWPLGDRWADTARA